MTGFRSSTIAAALFCCYLLVSLSHCGGGKTTEPDLRPANMLTAEGWTAFEAGDFDLAAAKFDSAQNSDPNFVDAHNGAGWTHARLGNFAISAENFEAALNRNGNLIEARAGASLTYHALNQFEHAISEAIATLLASPNFMFSHDASVDALDIRITLALSYFSVGEFANAAMQMDIIDPQQSPHSTQPDQLIQEIMRFFGQIR